MTMRKILAAALLVVFAGAAHAQNVSTVTIASGVPNSGTGTVSTLDNLIGTAGTAKANVLTVQGILSMTPLKVDGSGVTQPVSGTVAATQSGVWNVTNISGTVSLPTGAATAANQSTGNTSLATIATNSGSPIPDCGATPCTNKIGTVYLQGQIPAGAVVISGNVTGTTAAITGTLAGTTGKTTYICGLEVSAIGGTAAVGPISVAGLIGGTATYYLASTASGNILPIQFSPCWPASSTNTSITATTTADGTASGVAVNMRGFQQ